MAKEIAKEIGEAGDKAWQKRINDAIESGATGTEIFMALRWNFQEFLKENLDLSGQLKGKILTLISEINTSLKWIEMAIRWWLSIFPIPARPPRVKIFITDAHPAGTSFPHFPKKARGVNVGMYLLMSIPFVSQ
jgi:hypothetical protein